MLVPLLSSGPLERALEVLHARGCCPCGHQHTLCVHLRLRRFRRAAVLLKAKLALHASIGLATGLRALVLLLLLLMVVVTSGDRVVVCAVGLAGLVPAQSASIGQYLCKQARP
jgi:hypothetical protein